ncbi:DUF305 domain-containing protein [Aeromicrobium endophyticum]|uniref:DUF305 domain-containing protein n=1 Tax=Aeromicrobium endophyticum TaxID=2292704 RepID=A0A371PEX0_9ACTN|nr:DUF305 domain-containing protein [Aeromicrobium endophyticum]REK74048.1 DUF305 domain-containing protein [Aeromicrobium endophyticum]
MNRIMAMLAALPLVLAAACSSSGADHNDADVAFAQQMVPHHQQAVEMADLAKGADASADVTALAAQIRTAQAPEIAIMKEWLDDWDASTSHGGHDMGDGMMSDADMTELGTLAGTAFDRAWLTMMIAHHEGAVTMARTELANGKDADAKKLAQAIVDSQEKEIATMKGLLG